MDLAWAADTMLHVVCIVVNFGHMSCKEHQHVRHIDLRAIFVGEVPSLNHKTFNDPVEGRSLEMERQCSTFALAPFSSA